MTTNPSLILTDFNPEISVFKNVKDTTGLKIRLKEVVEKIRSNELADQTNKIRAAVLKGDFKQADRLKAELLPAITGAGVFKPRRKSGWLSASGLVCIDIDGLKSAYEVSYIIDKLSAYPYIVLSFVSPKGLGIKAFVRVSFTDCDETLYLKYWQAISRWLKDILGVENDSQTKDSSRLAFLCNDPDVYFNQDASYFPVDNYDTHDSEISVILPVQSLAVDENMNQRRYTAYIEKLPASIQGQNGSANLCRAIRYGKRFNLSVDTVRETIIKEFNPRCLPQWSDKEIDHALHSVFSKNSTSPHFSDEYDDHISIADKTLGSSQYMNDPMLYKGFSISIINGLNDWFIDLNNPSAIRHYPHTIPLLRVAPFEIALLGGGPGAGKTSLVLQIATDVLFNVPELHGVIVNVEMTAGKARKSDLITRILSRASGVDMNSIITPTPEQYTRLSKARNTLGEIQDRLHFINTTRWEDISEDAILATKGAINKLLIVDYIQRIDSGEGGSIKSNIDKLTDNLREFANKGWAVLALSSVSRQHNEKSGRSDYSALGITAFKESGSLEYCADIAALLNHKSNNQHSLTIVKDRAGECRTVPLIFQPNVMSFSCNEKDTEE